MAAYILKPEIIDEIKDDDDLLYIISKCLDLKLISMQRILKTNDFRLTTKTVLEAICQFLNKKNNSDLQEDDLLVIQLDEDSNSMLSLNSNMNLINVEGN